MTGATGVNGPTGPTGERGADGSALLDFNNSVIHTYPSSDLTMVFGDDDATNALIVLNGNGGNAGDIFAGDLRLGFNSTNPTITTSDTNETLFIDPNGTGNVTIGAGSGTATPNLLVLDDKNSSGDPSGVDGAMYYNSNTERFRCHENGGWRDCVNVPNMNYFTDASDTTWVDNNTTELWDGSTRPNITPNSTGNEVMLMVSLKATLNPGASATTNPVARVMRRVGATADCTVSSTQVGPTIGGGWSADGAANGVQSMSYVFVDNPGTTSNVSYTICTSSDSTLAGTNTENRIDVTLFEMNDAADLAEVYPTNDTDLAPGEIVSIDPNLTEGVTRSFGAYDQTVLGVVSTKPALLIGGTNGTGKGVPVALTGRVPVTVSTEGGEIKVGDYLTTSSERGVAMKAIKSGPVIGQAMTSFAGSGKGTVIVFIKNGTATGSFTDLLELTLPGITTDKSKLFSRTTVESLLHKLVDARSSLLEQSVQGIVTDRIAAGVDIVTPQLIAKDAFLERIQPASSSGTLTIDLGEEGKLLMNGKDGKSLLSIASDGLMTFLGKVRIDELSVGKLTVDSLDGTTADTSESNNLLADTQEKVSSLSGELTLIKELLGDQEAAEFTPAATTSATYFGPALSGEGSDFISQLFGLQDRLAMVEDYLQQSQQATPSSTLADQSVRSATEAAMLAALTGQSFNEYASILPDSVTLPTNLNVLGAASLGTTSIAGGLLVDGEVRIDGTSLSRLGDTLSLQPGRLGELDLSDGALRIDEDGTIYLGEATIAEDSLTVKGALAVGTIIGGEGGDLTIDLVGQASESGSTEDIQVLNKKLTIKGIESINAVSIDAFGSAMFNGSITTQKIAIAQNEDSKSRSVGQGTISAGNSDIEIANTMLTKNSLIYITPVSRTGNKVLYIKNQQISDSCSNTSCNNSFTVGIDGGLASEDIRFNWWIIN
jgi:hypothetical protein